MVYSRLTIGGVFGALPTFPSESMNLPNREYWLAPERRAQTMDTLVAWGLLLGVFTIALIAAVHYAIVDAHRATPPHMDGFVLWAPIITYAVAVFVMVVYLLRRFRKPN